MVNWIYLKSIKELRKGGEVFSKKDSVEQIKGQRPEMKGIFTIFQIFTNEPLH